MRDRPLDSPRRPPPGRTWRLPIFTTPPDTELLRLNDARYPDPAYFGKAISHRFDSTDGSYGVCYLGTTLDCCFLEVVKVVPEHADALSLTVSLAELGRQSAARARCVRPLKLACLADDGLAELGIDQRVTGGDDYVISRGWSRAIHDHTAQVDGILYPSRHHNLMYCVALFDQARPAVVFEAWGTLGDRATADLWVETARVLERFQIALI